MNTAKSYDPLAAHSFTKLWVQSVASSTVPSYPGLPVHSVGRENNRPGDALVAGLLLISLFAAALLIPFERLIPQERDGSKSSRSTSTGSLPKKKLGGMARGQYEEK